MELNHSPIFFLYILYTLPDYFTLMSRKKLDIHQDYLALLLLLIMTLWFGHEMVWGGKVPFFRDLGTYFYPMRFSLAESFKTGELPLWDRHVAMGFPLLADFQSGAFYPPHLFYLFLSFFTAVRVTYLFHYLVAATGGYMLCRQWGYTQPLALLGAILFTFGGTIVSLTNLLNHFQTAVWLPWGLFFWEKCLQDLSWKKFLFLTMVLLLQFLAGSPEFYAMSMGLLLLDGLRVKMLERNVTYRRTFFLFVAANVLVAGIAMVQILPTVELLMESRRRAFLFYPEVTAWSLHPLSLINLFFLDKQVDVGNLSPRLFFIPELPFLVSYYLGVIFPIGISLWFYYGSRKEKIILVGLTAASLIIAMGRNTPVYPFLFHYLPFFGLIRFPEKFFFITYALLLFVILKGLSLFLQSDHSSRGPTLIVSSICLLFFLPYLLLRFNTEYLGRFIAWATHTTILNPLTPGRVSSTLVNLEMQVALTCGFLILFFFRQKGKLRESLFNALIVTLVFIDLASAHRPYQYLLDPDVVHKSSRVITSPDAQRERIFFYPIPSNLHPSHFSLPKEPSFAQFNSVVFGNLLPNTGVFHGFDYMQEIDALGRWPYALFLRFANEIPPERQYRLLGALNVRYINSFRSLSGAGITLVQNFPEYPSWLYRIRRTVPRVYIVAKATDEKDPVKILDQLSSAKFDPLQEVILEKPLLIPAKKGFRAQAKIIQYGNQAVTIHASLNGPGVLVLADSFYPGWHAYVDGEKSTILRANLFFRAVPLPVGDHLVEFRYEPRPFKIGLVVSLVVLSGIMIWPLFLFDFRK